MKKRKRHTGWIVVLCMAAAIAVIAGIYSRFGGFGTGNCADTEEFAKYAASVSELTVPDEVQIVALVRQPTEIRNFSSCGLMYFRCW